MSQQYKDHILAIRGAPNFGHHCTPLVLIGRTGGKWDGPLLCVFLTRCREINTAVCRGCRDAQKGRLDARQGLLVMREVGTLGTVVGRGVGGRARRELYRYDLRVNES